MIKNFELEGIEDFLSLVKSFIASAIGMVRAMSLGLLGPFRCCMYPRNFRSLNV